MIREVLFVHHSHTDIGYTHPQPIVLDLHRGYINQALDIAEETEDYPDDARFRWTCEVTGVTIEWWNRASNQDRDRFLAAVKRGQFEVAAMKWNMTPLMDHSMILDCLKLADFFRDLGIPIRSAMNTDVNGLPWGMVDALLDHGIDGVSMSINEHYGHAPRPWPAAFKWEAPSGRKILAYNGMIYGATSDRMLRIPHSIDDALEQVTRWMKHFEGLGYAHPFLMMQITNLKYHDNNAPQRALPDFINAYNARAEAAGGVRLRFSTPTKVFNRLRSLPDEDIPTLRGDWTDWWNFGSGSTARGTSMGMRGQRDLNAARALSAVAPNSRAADRAENFQNAKDRLALFAEHTWGTDHSISRPGTADTLTQLIIKLSHAAEGGSVARMLKRDGLQDLCTEGEGDVPMVLLANPHPVAVKQAVKLPALPPYTDAPEGPRQMGQDQTIPGNQTRFLLHRQDVIATNLSVDGALWTEPHELPALSYKFVPVDEISAASTTGIETSEGEISNGLISVKLDLEKGGVLGLSKDSEEYAPDKSDLFRFGLPVYEAIESGDRDSMFAPINPLTPDWNRSWRTDWPAARSAGKLVHTTAPAIGRGQVSIRQDFELRNGDKASVTYRLLPGDADLQVQVVIDKTADAAPHSIYLPMPVNLSDDWWGEFETAGAVVEIDKEQLPFSSRHYVTTQSYMRLADDTREISVSCQDTPLWQVGDYNFARFAEPDGRVPREHPVLLAWLTNNYWSTNFQADQSGQITADFTVHVGPRRSRTTALQWAHCAALPIQSQLCDKGFSGTLGLYEFGVKPELGEAIATAVERTGANEFAFTLLNPGNEPTEVSFSTEAQHSLDRTNLAGREAAKQGSGTKTDYTMQPGEWCRMVVNMA